MVPNFLLSVMVTLVTDRFGALLTRAARGHLLAAASAGLPYPAMVIT